MSLDWHLPKYVPETQLKGLFDEGSEVKQVWETLGKIGFFIVKSERYECANEELDQQNSIFRKDIQYMSLSRIGGVGAGHNICPLGEKVSLNFTIFCVTDLQKIGVRADSQLREDKDQASLLSV